MRKGKEENEGQGFVNPLFTNKNNNKKLLYILLIIKIGMDSFFIYYKNVIVFTFYIGYNQNRHKKFSYLL